MKPLRILAASCALSLGVMAVPASAVTLIEDAGWVQFQFDDVGSSWDTEFDFTVTTLAELQVTDAFNSGDQFEVFINTVSQGLTSTPVEGFTIGNDFTAAFSDPNFSSASYLLGPGSYTVTGLTTLSPFGAGGAGIQLLSAQAAVPGFFAIGGPRRTAKRQQRVSVSYS